MSTVKHLRILLLLTMASFSLALSQPVIFKYTVRDGKTGAPISGATLSGQAIKLNPNGPREGFFAWGAKYRINGLTGTDGSWTYWASFASNWPHEITFEWDLQFNAPGYRVQRVSDKTMARKGLFDGADYEMQAVEQDVFLEPLKGEVGISGGLDLKTKSSDIGAMSAEEIAASLGVNTSDIVDLIINGKLRGKKIGSTYIVSKKDFDKWLSEK